MNRALVIPVALALAACTPELEGEWTGQCLTDEAEARVRLLIYEEQVDDPVVLASAWVHLAERPAETLHLECDLVEISGRRMDVSDCFGSWSAEQEPVADSFAIDGAVGRGDPTDALTGACTLEEHDGDLDLVRTP